MKPENKLEKCECGSKIVSVIDEKHKKNYIKFCSKCNKSYGVVKNIYADSRYNTCKKKGGKNVN